MKMAVIYHSVTGNTKNMGEQIVKGMNCVEGVEAKGFPIEDVDVEFVKEVCGVRLPHLCGAYYRADDELPAGRGRKA